MPPRAVAEFIRAQGWGPVTQEKPVGGGCINDGRVLWTAAGPQLFLKTNPDAPADMFTREAEGLAALAAVPGAPRVPAVYLAGQDFLLLEYLSPAAQTADYWETLGQQMAALHTVTHDHFGFSHDNYIGAAPQPNPWTKDGHGFFAEHRLRFQAARAERAGQLTSSQLRQLDEIVNRLDSLIPPQPASLIHGDLWSGNIIPGPAGRACLIDPAVYYGWAEADLAMTALFGRPPRSFYAAYESARPLAPGYQGRFDLYNLYHLLNHLNLFGESYRPSVEAILARYS